MCQHLKNCSFPECECLKIVIQIFLISWLEKNPECLNSGLTKSDLTKWYLMKQQANKNKHFLSIDQKFSTITAYFRVLQCLTLDTKTEINVYLFLA
jgi:hypothetical protein